MTNARVSEIFLSYQGEGPFTGSRQLFVRFYGCNLNCRYCDTIQTSYRTFTPQGLLSRILDLGDDYNELVLTGGEPLLHAGFLEDFLPFYKKHVGRPIYLETNGTLFKEYDRIAEWVDIAAMDIKLPSSTLLPEKDIWLTHKLFLERVSQKRLVIKAVVTDSTSMEDIKKVYELLEDVGNEPDVVLQPVTPEGSSVGPPDEEMLGFFKAFLQQKLGKNVMLLGQMHKLTGIK